MSTHINLQLRHASADLQKLAGALPFPVSRIWVAGAERKTPRGDSLEGTYQTSYLSLKVSSSSNTIAGAIAAVKQAFLAVPSEFRPMLANPSLNKCLYCTPDKVGEEIDLVSLKSLVEQGIELRLD